LGDAVNLASRLEGQTKYYGVNVLIGENTHNKVYDMAVLELDMIRVVGKLKPVRLYTLLGDEKYAETDDFKAWSAAHLQMLTCFRARDFDGALNKVSECEALSQGIIDGYYKMYKDRIKVLQKENLPKNWDGVYIAESK
jgi:adenylate cyclase